MITREIIRNYTVRVIVHRILRENVRRARGMPIKWNITAKATRFRGLMDQISAEYDDGADDAAEHLGDLKGLREQLGDMKADLHAAANVMGNGGDHSGESAKPVDESKPSPGQLTPSELKAAVEAANGQQGDIVRQEVGHASQPNFHE